MELHIAVVIPVYKAAAFVEDAVRSALAFEEVREVVLVEDGSPDNSLEVCERVAREDKRVRVVRHAGGANRGASASRNLGIRSSTSAFVAFLDADDAFLPNRFNRERELFARIPDADGVYGATGSRFHDDADLTRHAAIFSSELTTVAGALPPERLFAALLGAEKDFGHIHLDALTVKRSALRRLALAFDPDLRLHQDTDLILRLAHGARLHAGEIAVPVAVRGVHGGNRITAQESLAPSRHLLYSRLESWAPGAGVGKAETRVITARRIYYGILAGSSSATLGALIARPWLLRWVKVRELIFDKRFGAGSTLSRALRTLTWRLFGDGGGVL